jgi:hypothetical protein
MKNLKGSPFILVLMHVSPLTVVLMQVSLVIGEGPGSITELLKCGPQVRMKLLQGCNEAASAEAHRSIGSGFLAVQCRELHA